MFPIIKCDMCGMEFIEIPCSIYRLTFAGKAHHFCSYTCYHAAKETKERKDVCESYYKKLTKEAQQKA